MDVVFAVRVMELLGARHVLPEVYSICIPREIKAMNISRFATIAFLISALMAAGCANTIRGAGKDAANTVNAAEGAAGDVAGAAQ